MKYPLPEKISVLGVPFRVELAALSTDEILYGDMLGSIRRIRVDKEQDTRRQWTTLLHEFLHASLYVIGAGLSDEVEEMVVQSLEHSLEQFLKVHGRAFLAAIEEEQ